MPPPDDAAEIRAVWERGTRALCAGDWEGYRELWAHHAGVEVIHPEHRDWRVGWEVVGPGYQQLLTSGFRCEADTAFMRVHLSLDGQMAWATAEVRLKVHGAEAVERTLWQTLVFEKEGARWLLVHGHASVPGGG